LALLFLIALLGACTSTPGPTPEPFDPTGDWVLESGSVNGAPIQILADYPITFSVEGTEVGGRAACNGYGGRLQIVDGGIRVGELGAEQALCGGDPGGEVMLAETAFLRALEEVRAIRGEGDRMTLFGPTVELVFTRQAPIPIDAIVETDWVLETVIDGQIVRAAIGQPATLRIDRDGTFHGSTGCRTFTGSWVVAGGHMVATQTAMDGECPGGLAGQDGVVAEAVGGSAPSVDGDRLTLAKPGGVVLIYRRASE
jgi:heat shock protein HslJ